MTVTPSRAQSQPKTQIGFCSCPNSLISRLVYAESTSRANLNFITLLEFCRRVADAFATYLKVEDDGPDEPEGELGVAVDDVLAADVDEFDLLVAQEAQRGLHVLDRVEAHATALAGLFGF